MIILASGKWFSVLDPNPEDVELEDIAHALANQCRFTGHTKEFYSVAQHSVLVSESCPRRDAKWGLLHDASEAYLSDIARPIKKHPDFGPFYLAAEERLTKAIMTRFDLPNEMPKSVFDLDTILLRTEGRDLMPDTFMTEEILVKYPGKMLSQTIIPWNPKLAYNEFMFTATELGIS